MYVQSYTLLLADVFEKYQNMCLELYDFDPACFFYCTSLKKTKVKLDLLTDIIILLMVGKVIRERYVTLFIDMQKLINTGMIMLKIKNRHILNIGV